MLVLSRKPGESLRIGENIEIRVIEVKGELVRLGIEAPRSVQVWRGELWDAIVTENRKAAQEAAALARAGSTPADIASLLLKNKTKLPQSGGNDHG